DAAVGGTSRPKRRPDPSLPVRQSVPLRHLSADRRSGEVGGAETAHRLTPFVLPSRRRQVGTGAAVAWLFKNLLIKIDLVLVVKVSEIIGEDRARQQFLDVEHRVDHALANAVEGDLEAAVAHRVEPWTDGQHHPLGHVKADLAPLIDEPRAKILERL